jgi:hypothetical protein
MADLPLYPNALKRDNWKKQKGLIANVVKGETGTGAKLDALYTKFQAVEWQYWFPMTGGSLKKPKTADQLEARILAGKYNKPQLDKLRQEIAKVRKHCVDLGAKWSRSSVVPDSSVRHVKVVMVAACDVLDKSVEDAAEGDYDQLAADIQRLQAQTLLLIKAAIKDLTKHLPAVKQTPTVEVYKAGLHNGVRGVGVVLARQPKYLALYNRDWLDKSGDDYMDGVHDGAEVLAKVTEIEGALRRLKRELAAG